MGLDFLLKHKKTREPTHGKKATRVVTGFSFFYVSGSVSRRLPCLRFPSGSAIRLYVAFWCFHIRMLRRVAIPGFVSILTSATQIPLLQGSLQFKP